MTTRLQVLFDEEELAAIRSAARDQRLTVAEWVRQTLRRALHETSRDQKRRKFDVVREASRFDYPTADVEQLLAESARGRAQASAESLAIAERLLGDLDGDDADAQAAWDAEIARRLARLEAGEASLRPAADVFADLDRRFGW